MIATTKSNVALFLKEKLKKLRGPQDGSEPREEEEHDWEAQAVAGLDYIAARPIYPSYLISAMLAYHHAAFVTHNSSKGKRQAALDLGSGPGQLAFHLATKFDRVYARDPSEDSIKMGRGLVTLIKKDQNTTNHVRNKLGIADAIDGQRVDFAVGSAVSPNVGEQVDSITIANALHCFDWSTPESCRILWSTWTKLLRPGGTVFVIGQIPTVGPFAGEMGEATRPLRQLLMGASYDPRSPILQYYSNIEAQKRAQLGAGEFYNSTTMPWELKEDKLSAAWQSKSRAYFVFDFPQDLRLPSGFTYPRSDGVLADWMPEEVRKAVSLSQDIGNGYSYSREPWRTTTPRKMARWVSISFLPSNVYAAIY